MAAQPPSAKAIFDEAVELTDSAERQAFLDRVYADAPELRQKVDGLLRAHDAAGSFLHAPPAEFAATMDESVFEKPETIIGPYKLLEQIGEGGMGTVWMAQQTAPVKR